MIKAVKHFILASLFFNISLLSAASHFYEQEHQALVDFYHSTQGSDWVRQDNWLSETIPHCEWHGVICNSEGSVIEIQLYDNGLDGPLPESIGNLQNLKTLYLSFNRISGAIPSTLGASTPYLENVWLKANRLEGEIPATLFQSGRLKWVDLHVNRLTGSLPYIAENPDLAVLRLEENNLSGLLPDSLFHLSGLTELYLHENQFSGPLSAEIAKLSQLQHLFLGRNTFSGPLPQEIGSLNNLISLRLEYNYFSDEIPESLATLPNLQVLRLDHNLLTLPAPQELLQKQNRYQVFELSDNPRSDLSNSF